jgi:predicted membrane-bound spermidine synthase
MDQRASRAAEAEEDAPSRAFPAVIYVAAFVTGAIVMSFEMLGSRYLNPYFGSGIYTWASLISTVLAALCVGYLIGGVAADRYPSAAVLGATVLIGSAYILVLPLFSETLMELVLAAFDDVKAGSLAAAFAILFFPVTFLGMYSPFGIRLLLRSPQSSGRVSGTVYGISTLGSIVGTLGTTFYLIPVMGTRAITLTLGVAGILAGLVLMALPRLRAPSAFGLSLLLLFAVTDARASDLIDAAIRAEMLSKPDGRIARIETEYNDIFVTKRRNQLTMSFQLKGFDYTESVANLTDPDDLPVRYTQVMTVGVLYPPQVKRILMIGLGGGSISSYLGRYLPDAEVDTVEIDPGVITAAKRYFGMRETPRVRYLEGDGRVFLNRRKETYDLILVDAFHGGYVPFHLLTKVFYTLLKARLAPGGAVAFNVHDGTKLYASTLLTLRAVFPAVHLYPSGEGEMITVATGDAAPEPDVLAGRAVTMQEKFGFRFALPTLLARRTEKSGATQTGEMLTDDFAPVNLYDTMGEKKRKK